MTEQGQAPATLFLRGFFLSCQKETPQTPKRKPLWCMSEAGTVFYGFPRVGSSHPVIGWLCPTPTVRCFASLAALPRRSPGGKGAEPPINAAASRTFQTTPKPSVGGLRPPRASRSPAPASAGGVSSPILPRKMGHIRKPRQVSGTQRRKHRNGRPHRAAKIAPGLCLGAIPYLAPLRRNRAAVRRAKYMGLRGKSPGGPYIFYGGEPTRGTPGPPRIFFYSSYIFFSLSRCS